MSRSKIICKLGLLLKLPLVGLSWLRPGLLLVLALSIFLFSFPFSFLFSFLGLTDTYIYAQNKDEFDREIESFLQEEPLSKKGLKQGKDSTQEEGGTPEQAAKAPSHTGTVIDWANLPHILVNVDMVGDWNLGKSKKKQEGASENTEEPASDSANIREIDFGFDTAIDQWAYGTALFTVHNEAGEYFVELHEAYFEFNQLPYNFFLKLGNFFMDIGRLNNRHRHSWKFTKAPLVHEELFDDEGVEDFGGELSFLMPLSFYQEFKVGMFNGRTFGHSHDEDLKKPNPLFTGRIKNFFLLGESLGTQVGFSYLRYNVDEDPKNYWEIGGLDLTFKQQRGALQSFEWSTEFWYRKEYFAQGESRERYGYYSFIGYQPWSRWKMWHFGLRWDHFVRRKDFDAALGEKLDKHDFGQTLSVTLKPSEFSYFRFSVERQDYYKKEDEYLLLIQADFVLGYHKPHIY